MSNKQNHRDFLVGILILIASFTLFTNGQQKDKKGYLIGNVALGSYEPGGLGKQAPGIIVELKNISKNKTIKIVSDEVGFIEECILTGDYLLVSAKASQGVPLKFASNQNMKFQIKSNKTKRFDIVVVLPEN